MNASAVFWSLVDGLAEPQDVEAPSDEEDEEDEPGFGAGAGDQSAAAVNSELAAFEARLRKSTGGGQDRTRKRRPAAEPMARDGFAWSNEAPAFAQLVKADAKRGKRPELHSRAFQAGFFANVRLDDRDIGTLDAGFGELDGIRNLDLTGNRLHRLVHLPPSLEQLDAYNNQITDVAARPAREAVLHAGLGYNALASASALAAAFPALLSLDISCNNLCGVDALCRDLGHLPALRQLWVARNPLALAPGYRDSLVAACPGLLFLDDVQVREEEDAEEAAGRRARVKRGQELPPGAVTVQVSLDRLTGVASPPLPDARSAEVEEAEPAGKGKGKGKPDPAALKAEAEEEQRRREEQPVDGEQEVHFVASVVFEVSSGEGEGQEWTTRQGPPARWQGSNKEVNATAQWRWHAAPTPALRDALLLNAARVTVHRITPVAVLACLRERAEKARNDFEALPEGEKEGRSAPHVPDEPSASETVEVASFSVALDSLFDADSNGRVQKAKEVPLDAAGPLAQSETAPAPDAEAERSEGASTPCACVSIRLNSDSAK